MNLQASAYDIRGNMPKRRNEGINKSLNKDETIIRAKRTNRINLKNDENLNRNSKRETNIRDNIAIVKNEHNPLINKLL